MQSRSIEIRKDNGNTCELKVVTYEQDMVDIRIDRTQFGLEIEDAKVFVENLQWGIAEAEKYK